MSQFPKTVYGKELIEMMSSHEAYDSNANKVALAGVIRDESVYSLQQLILENRPQTTLEIGMAMGMSILAILYALQKIGGGTHTAIDPHQRAGSPDGYNGVGLSMVKRAGFAENFEFLEQP